MKECLLCNNEADKKDLLIISHFLIKRIDNEERSSERDKESVRISNNGRCN